MFGIQSSDYRVSLGRESYHLEFSFISFSMQLLIHLVFWQFLTKLAQKTMI